MSLCRGSKVSEVTAITDEVFRITRDECSICVAKCGKVVIVLDDNCRMPDKGPFVALVHTFGNESDAYSKCMFLIGKMCKKDTSSKYFANHKFEEHMKNGSFDKVPIDDVQAAVRYVDETISEYYSKICR